MSRENVKVVRRLYRAMDSRDLSSVEELTHSDVEWIPDQRVGEGPVRGRKSVVEFFSERNEVLDDLRTEVERFWETDEKVVTFVRITGRGAASGAPFDIRIGHVFTLRNGVVIRGEGYGNRDEALQVAGLSE